jgi:hypothetical protein
MSPGIFLTPNLPTEMHFKPTGGKEADSKFLSPNDIIMDSNVKLVSNPKYQIEDEPMVMSKYSNESLPKLVFPSRIGSEVQIQNSSLHDPNEKNVDV